jgi:hypothetical protein
MAVATSNAEVTMKPSISSSIPRSAAASIAPAIIAISKPPNSASTSSASASGGSAARPTACASKVRLRASPAVSRPVPRPTQSARGAPVSCCVSSDAGGGIADAHFAEGHHPATLVGQAAGDGGAACQRQVALCGAHRRLFDRVARAEGDLGVDQAIACAEIVRHASIYHLQLQAVVAGENIDRRASGEKVLDHLPGHFLRVGRDTGHGRRRGRRRRRADADDRDSGSVTAGPGRSAGPGVRAGRVNRVAWSCRRSGPAGPAWVAGGEMEKCMR